MSGAELVDGLKTFVEAGKYWCYRLHFCCFLLQICQIFPHVTGVHFMEICVLMRMCKVLNIVEVLTADDLV